MKQETETAEKKYYFTFGSGLIEDGLNSYVKVIAEDVVQARKIMFASEYGGNFSFTYSEKDFLSNFNIEKMNCIDVFSQSEKDYILEWKNDKGYVEKNIISEDELFDLSEKMWPEPTEEYSEDEDVEIENMRINYLKRENGGEAAIVEMLRDYEDYIVIDLDIERKKEKILSAYGESPKIVSEAIYDELNWGSKPMRSTMENTIKTQLTDRMVEKINKVLFTENLDVIPSAMQENSTDDTPNNTQKPQ